jgi:hypothetical protein
MARGDRELLNGIRIKKQKGTKENGQMGLIMRGSGI